MTYIRSVELGRGETRGADAARSLQLLSAPPAGTPGGGGCGVPAPPRLALPRHATPRPAPALPLGLALRRRGGPSVPPGAGLERCNKGRSPAFQRGAVPVSAEVNAGSCCSAAGLSLSPGRKGSSCCSCHRSAVWKGVKVAGRENGASCDDDDANYSPI